MTRDEPLQKQVNSYRGDVQMKRLTLVLLVAALVVPGMAQAQGLTMQMSNGWKFTFSGNVNAFFVYSADANSGPKNTSIRTGLLPGFVVFDAKGKESGMDLGVHVGFAPQINNAGTFNQGGGAQIDMRQLFLTVGFKNGSQILAGRELGVFQRQNILNDMTLFGVGAIIDPQGGGTTLGRIGYGYIYPNFNAQITYSTAANKSFQLTAGLFQPAIMTNGFDVTGLPRIEAEVTVSPAMSGTNRKVMVWGGAMWQQAKDAPTGGLSVSATGVTAGAKLSMADFGVVVAAYTGTGMGSTLFFVGDELADADNQRKSDGGYAQVTYAMGKSTFGLSWGVSRLKGAGAASADGTDAVVGELSSWTAGAYHQWTKSLKLVGEATLERNENQGAIAVGGGVNRTVISGGLMLFF